MRTDPLLSGLGLGILLTLPLAGNEALDLLEGQKVGLSTASWPVATVQPDPFAASRTSRAPADVPDYSWRWISQLPPAWSFYQDYRNPVVQEAALTGLFDWRMERGTIKPKESDAPIGNESVDSSKARRARLGTVLRAFYNTDLEANVVLDGKGNWKGVERLKATVHASDDLSFSFGKFRPPFSMEYSRDPSVRWFPEPSAIATQIVPANSLGAMVTGYSGRWDWGMGWFSSDASENLPGFEGAGYALFKLGYTFQGGTGKPGEYIGEDGPLPDAPLSVYQRWHLDYIYNFDGADSASIPNDYRHLFSAGVEVSAGRFDFGGDFLIANGNDHNAWGATLQGAYWLLDEAIRLVGRYSYAESNNEGGILAGYGVPDPTSDSLNAFAYPIVRRGGRLSSFYAGLNFHVISDYVVLYTGVEYRILENPGVSEDSTLEDLHSWFWHAGGRAAF